MAQHNLKNKIKLFLLMLLFVPALQASKESCSEKFRFILTTMQEATETEILYSVLADAIRTSIEKSCDSFDRIEKLFSENIFASYKRLTNSFRRFSITVSNLRRVIHSTKNVRPAYVRWLQERVTNLGKMAKKAIGTEACNKQSLLEIVCFYRQMKSDVFPDMNMYIGTSGQKTWDNLVQKPWEFYKRNWFWVTPLVVCGSILAVKGCQMIRDSWLGKVAAAGAGLILLRDGQILIGGHKRGRVVEKPISQMFSATFDSQTCFMNTVREGEEEPNIFKHKIVQDPSLKQKGLACGYHAIFNLMRYHRWLNPKPDKGMSDEPNLIKRTKFNEQLKAWKMLIEEKREGDEGSRMLGGKELGYGTIDPRESNLHMDEILWLMANATGPFTCKRNSLPAGEILGEGRAGEMVCVAQNVTLWAHKPRGDVTNFGAIIMSPINTCISPLNTSRYKGYNKQVELNKYRYQNHNEPQYILINTGEEPNKCIEGMKCNFKTKNPYGCHYVACLLMKDKDGFPILRIADSMCEDNRRTVPAQQIIKYFHYDQLEEDLSAFFAQIIALERRA